MSHLDYSIHAEATPIELIIYKSRLEIRNPGGLYGCFSFREVVFTDLRNEFMITFYSGEKEALQVKDTSDHENEALLESCKDPCSRKEIAVLLSVNTIYYVSQKYINLFRRSEKVKMTIPEHPKSKNQKIY